jgi:adenylate cyclase
LGVKERAEIAAMKSQWLLTVRVSGEEPFDYTLKPGENTIGREVTNDIVINEDSASRGHAVIEFDPEKNLVSISDSGSTNGTFVNRRLLQEITVLWDGDEIRIGSSQLKLVEPRVRKGTRALSGSHLYSRDQVLEALDHHAVLLYDISERLNTMIDLDEALVEVANLMERSMGADECIVVLQDQFQNLNEMNFPQTIADNAVATRSAIVLPDPTQIPGASAQLIGVRSAMCIPIISGEEVIGLIYMYKTDYEVRPFDENDLRVAIAISHQAALTIQRMQLLQRVRKEQNVLQVLQRFVSPQEAEFLMDDYEESADLPGLSEKFVSVLFADITESSRLAEELGATQFGALLNEYYRILTKLIFEHNGVVRYLGDGVMAVFGVVGDQANIELNAVKTGLEILSSIVYDLAGFEVEVQVGIGITSGDAVVGYVGTDQRVELSVLGDSVNVAHILQSYARPNRLIVDELTAEALDGKYLARKLPPIKAKGRQTSVQAFEIVAKREKWSELFC